MKVILSSDREQFGPQGPKNGDVGNVFAFGFDDSSEVIFYAKFPGHPSYFILTSDIVINDKDEIFDNIIN